MKSILIPEPGKVEIIDRAIPQRKPGEALVKLLYGGICGTDLNSYRGTAAYTVYPCYPGHEFSAEIVEIDKDVSELQPGMTVICNPYYNCGSCYACKHGLVNACMDNKTLGVQREGAFSEFFSIPVERLYNGKGLPPRTLALIEPFCISYHIAKRTQVSKGDTVLIVGAGTIGVLSAIAAQVMGAEVTICDIAQAKMDYAMQTFNIPHCIQNKDHDSFMAKVLELTDGNGYDVTIDAAGFPSTFKNCVDALAYGGRLGLSGYSKDNLNDFNYSYIQKKELSLFGSRNAIKLDFEEVIDLVSHNHIDLEKIVTNEYSWLDAPRAFREFDKNAGNTLKVLLNFNL